MSDLAERQCAPRSGGVPALRGQDLRQLAGRVPGWQVAGEHHLERSFTFPDFKQALEFVNRVGELAEQQGHHPELMLTWGRVEAKIWTHKIDGLTESDFILAAKINRLPGA